MVCETAIIKLESLLGELSALDAEKKAALAKARGVYAMRISSAAATEGKSDSDVAIDRRARLQPGVDRSVELQTGLTCLRQLVPSQANTS